MEKVKEFILGCIVASIGGAVLAMIFVSGL